MTNMAPSKEAISFGPFELVASERRLSKDGVRIALGARAFDILAALLSRPNEVISKADLMGRVWPGVTVDEVSLRFHMAGLRKALGDGQGGARYISTMPGHGYSFIAPVSRTIAHATAVTPEQSELHGHARLPIPSAMVGRDEDVLRVSSYLTASRFVTIVGTGGIGKTTLAVAVGHHLTATFEHAICFVDFGAVTDSDRILGLILSVLGLSIPPSGTLQYLIGHLQARRILLILDTCEHLIEPIADLASRIFAETREVHILATSRETFRSDGEHVYWLEPLACPPEGTPETAATVRSFPATHLFLQCAAANGAHLILDDGEAAIIIRMCRRLEGVPLAIELAARRVETFGLLQTADILDTHLKMLWTGTRTAPPRQRTLRATLEWSYILLSTTEAVVLRRLAGFPGPFSLHAALSAATCQTVDEPALLDAIDGLVAKSLIVPPASKPCGRFRLLDATRAFAREKLVQAGESDPESARVATLQQDQPALKFLCG